MPLTLWLGVRSWTMLAAFVGSWLAFGVAGRSARNSGRALPPAVFITGFAAQVTSAFLFGPFVLLPGTTTMLVINTSMAPRRSRWPILMLGLAMIAVPWALMHSGLLPGGMRATGDALTLTPLLVSFPPWKTDVVLLLLHGLVLFLASFLAADYRKGLDEAERRLIVQAWQLRQLIPQEIRALAGTSSGR